jgi:hypothetical protein
MTHSWRWLEVDEKVVQLRTKYVPLVKDTLPGKKAAAFFQLDERISMMIDLEFASQTPLLHGRLKKNKPPRPCTRLSVRKKSLRRRVSNHESAHLLLCGRCYCHRF